jgi:teichuronic acid exporter
MSPVNAIKFTLFAKIFRIIFGILLLSQYGRILGPEILGVFVIMLNFIQLSSSLIEGGTVNAYLKSDEDSNISNLFYTYSVFLGILLAATLFLIKAWIEEFFSVSYSNLTYVLFCLYFIVSATIVQKRAFLLKSKRFDDIFVVETISLLVSGTVSLVMIYNGFGVISLVIKYLLEVSLISIIYRYKYKLRNYIVIRSINKKEKDLFWYGQSIVLSRLIGAIGNMLDRFFVSAYYPVHQAGYYVYSKVVASMPNDIIRTSITSPALSYAAKYEGEESFVRFQFVSLVLIATAFPLAFLILIHGELILTLLMGSAWQEFGKSMQILGIFAIGSLIKGWLAVLYVNNMKVRLWNKLLLLEALIIVSVISVVYLNFLDKELIFFIKSYAFSFVFYWLCIYMYTVSKYQKFKSRNQSFVVFVRKYRLFSYICVFLLLSFILGVWRQVYMSGLDNFLAMLFDAVVLVGASIVFACLIDTKFKNILRDLIKLNKLRFWH